MGKFLKIQEHLFDGMIILSYILIFLTYLGFYTLSTPKYIEMINYYIKIYICMFLIIRFNPLKKNIKFTNFDQKIIFTSGFMILTTSVINQYLI
jgi:hypothetical protein